MSHISAKIRLTSLPGDRRKALEVLLTQKMGLPEIISHTDSIYKVGSAVVKVRRYDDNKQEMIMERLDREVDGMRRSLISVAFLRLSERDSNTADILGNPACAVKKNRMVWGNDSVPMRVYWDFLPDVAGEEFLEVQIDDQPGHPEKAIDDIKNVIAVLGFEPKDIIKEPYNEILKKYVPASML